MKIFTLIFLITLCSCASPHKNQTAGKEQRTPLALSTIEEVAERVRKTIEPQMGEGKNVGAIIGIYLQGKSKFLPFGETKKGNKTPPDENTIFEIGSLTKTFTALLLAQEIGLKKVKESDTISSIQKKWAGQKNGDITLLELVTHRSGLPRLPCNMNKSDSTQPNSEYAESDLLDLLNDKSLAAHPDCVIQPHPTNTINYSNVGFGTLGYVLGLKEKTSYMDLLNKRILKPLNMEDTSYELNKEQLTRVAQGYDEKGNVVPMWKKKILMGNGAIRSTAAEMFLYAQAYLHPETTSIKNAIEHVTQVQFDDKSKKIGYAWSLYSNGSFSHDGMTGGYASYLKIYPKKDFAIFYLTNTARDLKCINEAVNDLPCVQ